MQIAHTVKAGEDIGVIANLYGVDYKEILADNNLGAYDPIEPNDVIEVNITDETITPAQYEIAGAQIESDLADVDRMSATRLARSSASPYVGEDLEEPAVELESVADADASTEEKDLLDRIWNSVKSGAKQVFGQDEGIPPEAAAQELTDTEEDKSNILVRDQNITGDGILSLEAQAALKQVEDVKEDEGEVVPDLETGMKPVPLKVETEEVVLDEKPATKPMVTEPVSYEEPSGDPGKPVQMDDNLIKQITALQEDVASTISQKNKLNIFKDQVKFINDLNIDKGKIQFRFFGDKKADYEALRDEIDLRIDSYETTIADIAAEKQKPPLEGTNMWLAVIGVALGAAGSALNRTPNEAMQMLNSFLDREQQKFLRSKEMKMKSAENQRLDLIRRRGALLQQFQNETQKMIQIAQFQLAKTKALANIKAIEQQLVDAQVKNKQDYEIRVANILKDVLITKATLSQQQGNRYYTGIGEIQGKPNKSQFTRMDKELSQMSRGLSQIRNYSARAYDALDNLKGAGLIDTILQSGALKKGLKGEDYKQLENAATEIFLAYKNDIAKVGQAMSAKEQALVERIIPETDLSEVTLGGLETALKEMNEAVKIRVLSYQESNNVRPLPGDENYERFSGEKNPKDIQTYGGEKRYAGN